MQEQVSYLGNNQRSQNNPYSSTYNPGWRNHPNFSWGNWNGARPQVPPQPQLPPHVQPTQDKPSPLAEALEKLTQQTSAFVQQTTNFMTETRATLKNHESMIRNLESQIGQVSKQLSERAPGNFPSNTVINPREQCQAIMLRSGKVIEDPIQKNSAPQKEMLNKEREDAEQTDNNKRERGEQKKFHSNVPYPQLLKPVEKKRQFDRFLDIFKKVQINIPLIEALEQMPSYTKFMKELLSKKRKMRDGEVVKLNEECSAIIQQKLPPKLKDPGTFTIPCMIGDIEVGRALCDLGASVNLMPLSIFNKLGIGEVKETMMSLQLADRSIKYPYGIVEDLLVKVDKFIFPADFVILDMEEDARIPLILGRPFLATGRALIDVEKGELMLRVQDEQVTFKVFDAVKHPIDDASCMMLDIIDDFATETFDTFHSKEPLKVALTHDYKHEDLEMDSMIFEAIQQLEAQPFDKLNSAQTMEDLRDKG